MPETKPDVERLLSDYEDVWNGDFSKIDVLSESFEYSGPAAPDGGIHGRDAQEAFIREFLTGFPDFSIGIDEMLVGDEVVMLEWTATGTHEGEFNDIPPTEREIDITGMGKVQIADGKVQKEHVYYDLQELFEQLGLTEE